MANNYPDGGERPLSSGEMTVMALYGIVLVSAPISLLLLHLLSQMGPRPGPAMIAVTCALGLAIGALWVRPWNPTPHRRR